MIHLSDAERIELRMAEMSSVCGPITLYSDDPWNPAGNSNWVQWCGKVQQYNPPPNPANPVTRPLIELLSIIKLGLRILY